MSKKNEIAIPEQKGKAQRIRSDAPANVNFLHSAIVAIKDLQPHPLHKEIYREFDSSGIAILNKELVDDIAKNGLLQPILITSNRIILAGHSRVAACKWLGEKEVSCDVLEVSGLVAEQIVIGSNWQREKTLEQKGREFKELKRIETSLAKQRMSEGGKKGKANSPNLATLKINKHLVNAQVGDWVNYNTSSGTRGAQIVALDDKEVTIKTGTTDKSIHKFPLSVDCNTIRQNITKHERENASENSGQARDLAAAKVGLRPRTAEKLAEVIQAADAGDTDARSGLDKINETGRGVEPAYNNLPKPTNCDVPACPETFLSRKSMYKHREIAHPVEMAARYPNSGLRKPVEPEPQNSYEEIAKRLQESGIFFEVAYSKGYKKPYHGFIFKTRFICEEEAEAFVRLMKCLPQNALDEFSKISVSLAKALETTEEMEELNVC